MSVSFKIFIKNKKLTFFNIKIKSQFEKNILSPVLVTCLCRTRIKIDNE